MPNTSETSFIFHVELEQDQTFSVDMCDIVTHCSRDNVLQDLMETIHDHDDSVALMPFGSLEALLDNWLINVCGDDNAAMLDRMERWIEDQQSKPFPCPYCGKTYSVQVKSTHHDDRTGLLLEGPHDTPQQWHVICSAQKGGCGSATGFRDEPEDAIALWNKAKR